MKKQCLTLSFSLIFLCFGPIGSVRQCSFSPDTSSLECTGVQLQEVYSDSLASAERAGNITMKCTADHQATKALLTQNHFVHLHNLSGLAIHKCGKLEMEIGALEGLRNLISLQVLLWQLL